MQVVVWRHQPEIDLLRVENVRDAHPLDARGDVGGGADAETRKTDVHNGVLR